MRYLIILFLVFTPLSAIRAEPLNVGSMAPDWSLKNREGETINYYQDSDNKVSIILFWATWCPYCATLMPHLEVVFRKSKNKGLKFYAIDTFEDGKLDPVEYFTGKEFTYTLLLDGDEVANEFSVQGTPGLFVVGKDKKIIYKRPGGISDVLVKQNVDLKVKQALAK